MITNNNREEFEKLIRELEVLRGKEFKLELGYNLDIDKDKVFINSKFMSNNPNIDYTEVDYYTDTVTFSAGKLIGKRFYDVNFTYDEVIEDLKEMVFAIKESIEKYRVLFNKVKYYPNNIEKSVKEMISVRGDFFTKGDLMFLAEQTLNEDFFDESEELKLENIELSYFIDKNDVDGKDSIWIYRLYDKYGKYSDGEYKLVRYEDMKDEFKKELRSRNSWMSLDINEKDFEYMKKCYFSYGIEKSITFWWIFLLFLLIKWYLADI